MQRYIDVGKKFLSTPSARRATFFIKTRTEITRLFLSTPSARRATEEAMTFAPYLPISIHALREEGDDSIRGQHRHGQYFYPRPPRGGRRHDGRWRGRVHLISIHALREEGDGVNWGEFQISIYFYPRPPRGGRPPYSMAAFTAAKNFYPRPPRGGRLRCCCGSWLP